MPRSEIVPIKSHRQTAPKRQGLGGGRPTKLTPAMHKLIVEAIKNGVPYAKASSLAGISEHTIYHWKRRGKELSESGAVNKSQMKYLKFFNAVKKAEAEYILQALVLIHRAASGGDIIKETRRTYGNIKRADGSIQQVLKTEVITEKPSIPQWQAAAWLLERRHPEEFGRRRPPANDTFDDVADAIHEIVTGSVAGID